MLILADALLQAPDRVLRPGRLRVSGRHIREVGNDLRPQLGEEVLELPGLTLSPGFLNLHAHLELGPLHGKIRPGLPFAEWLRGIKGGPLPGSNFAYSGPFAETVLLSNVAIRSRRRIEWDSQAMKVTNVPDANQFVTKEYRPGWV